MLRRSVLFTVAVLAGLASLTARSAGYDYDGVPLKMRDVAPFAIGLPDWEVLQVSDLGAKGRIQVADPAGNGRMFQVSWQRGKGMTPSMMSTMLGNVGVAALPSAPLSPPLQGDALRFEVKEKGRRVTIATLYCKASDTTVTAMAFLDGSWDEQLRMTEKVLGTAQCHDVPAMTPNVPRLSRVPGYTRRQSPQSGIVFSEDHGGGMIILPDGMAPSPFLAQRDMQVKMFTAVLQNVGMREIAFQDGTRRLSGKELLFGDALDASGARVHLVTALWQCEKPAQLFIAIYFGPGDPQAKRIPDILASAACP